MKDFLCLLLIINLIVLGVVCKDSHNKIIDGTYDCEYEPPNEKADWWMVFFPITYLDTPQFIKDYCEHGGVR